MMVKVDEVTIKVNGEEITGSDATGAIGNLTATNLGGERDHTIYWVSVRVPISKLAYALMAHGDTLGLEE